MLWTEGEKAGAFTVLVVSASRLTAETLACLAGKGRAVEAAHAAGHDAQEAAAFDAHVVVVETSSAGDATMVGEVASACPGARVVLLVRRPGPWCDRLVADTGVVGWCSLSMGEDMFATLLASVHRTGRLPAWRVGVGRNAPVEARCATLTRREADVLRLVAAGCHSGAIAGRLAISPNTVRSHLQNILGKLDVHSRGQAVAVARRMGVFGESWAPAS